MVKDRRRLKKPAGYRFHIPLIFFAAAFLVFGLVKNQSGKSDMPPGGTVLSSLFGAAQTELNVSSGLPQLEKGSKKAEAPAEEPGSGADIPESLTDSGELKLILNRRPIAGITINPSEPDSASKIAIKNETSYSPDINALVKLGPSLKLSGDGPQVLIFHTHTTESYTPTG
ncbi:MAG: stage II sporulation protein P, partial [Bacillota bacterium]|nr:stage II sporulation protein P [Bacillota bacterium]